MKSSTRRREERLEVRLSATAKRLLQRAAAAQQKTISAFVLDSGMTAAAEALTDRREIQISAKAFDEFLEALDARPKSKPRLDRLLSRASVLE